MADEKLKFLRDVISHVLAIYSQIKQVKDKTFFLKRNDLISTDKIIVFENLIAKLDLSHEKSVSLIKAVDSNPNIFLTEEAIDNLAIIRDFQIKSFELINKILTGLNENGIEINKYGDATNYYTFGYHFLKNFDPPEELLSKKFSSITYFRKLSLSTVDFLNFMEFFDIIYWFFVNKIECPIEILETINSADLFYESNEIIPLTKHIITSSYKLKRDVYFSFETQSYYLYFLRIMFEIMNLDKRHKLHEDKLYMEQVHEVEVPSFFSCRWNTFSGFIVSAFIEYIGIYNEYNYIKICNNCGIPFISKKSGETRGLYCSNACKSTYNYNKRTDVYDITQSIKYLTTRTGFDTLSAWIPVTQED
ncbi:MAG: hypothetical protein HQK82_15195 [Desulfovibrionaceae bacterium]|nr:hypothetical protein [Desulfovibrionaceae bacterium]